MLFPKNSWHCFHCCFKHSGCINSLPKCMAFQAHFDVIFCIFWIQGRILHLFARGASCLMLFYYENKFQIVCFIFWLFANLAASQKLHVCNFTLRIIMSKGNYIIIIAAIDIELGIIACVLCLHNVKELRLSARPIEVRKRGLCNPCFTFLWKGNISLERA